MKIEYWVETLQLAHTWRIAGGAGSSQTRTLLVRLTDADGAAGLGEASPPSLYGQSIQSAGEWVAKLDAARLSFHDLPGSMAYLAALAGGEAAALGAVNQALLDGAARLAAKPVHKYFGLDFREGRHVTSVSIGLDAPEVIRAKTREMADYPVLKLKMGDPRDRENLAALRAAAPDKPVRVDANEGWRTKEHALDMLEWLAGDGNIQFVEQPLHRTAPAADLAWLKERSPLPLFADESCHTVKDIPQCAEFFHGVNVKLVKTGGISMAFETLRAARRAGLQTMIGCMIESSVLITAAAQLAELADHLDLDGNLLITNDPFEGVTTERGVLSLARAPLPTGLQVRARSRVGNGMAGS
jgi:L-alanine-DL-glutamate epimerase-like enolase superfamily enzyme